MTYPFVLCVLLVSVIALAYSLDAMADVKSALEEIEEKRKRES